LTGLLFLEAVIISAWMRFVLSFLSGTFRLRYMGTAVTLEPTAEHLNPDTLKTISRVQLAVARVNRYVPWNTECYTQALTAKYLLKTRKIDTLLTIGFKKDDTDQIQGHAWLTINEWVITGMRHDLSSYVVNGRFY
jgi:hypothetical protein